ncbi:hypothetical protein CCMA1212_007453 [Trichoderma ghanense]|uniref:Uncharacterized protein n=1 Tax=Trichoderma ghanense TaxID=65468 RepID=A0ABY2GYF0_9HYPO
MSPLQFFVANTNKLRGAMPTIHQTMKQVLGTGAWHQMTALGPVAGQVPVQPTLAGAGGTSIRILASPCSTRVVESLSEPIKQSIFISPRIQAVAPRHQVQILAVVRAPANACPGRRDDAATSRPQTLTDSPNSTVPGLVPVLVLPHLFARSPLFSV